MTRHNHLNVRGIGWGTTTEHGRRVAAVHYDVVEDPAGSPPPSAARERGNAPGEESAPGARPMAAAFQGAQSDPHPPS